MISREKSSSEEIAVCEFTVDTVAEIAQLPTLTTGNETMGWDKCLHGSSAFVNETGDLFTIRGDNTWKKVGEA